MLYCTRAQPTNSATDDTDGTSANVTLNTKAKRILYVGAYETQVTFTAAEGQHRSVIITGDVTYGGTVSRIPMSPSRHSSLVGGDKHLLADLEKMFFPVKNWITGPNAVITANTRGVGGTNASEADVFIIYSDGEGHPPRAPIWGGASGLRDIPQYYIRSDLTAISNSTTETAGNAITRPVGASRVVGLGTIAVADGTAVAADESNTRVRFTANGIGTGVHFEPDQIWPVSGGAYGAGLQGLANASVDADPFTLEWLPLTFPIDTGGTVTPNWTMRSAITNAVEHYIYGAFA